MRRVRGRVGLCASGLWLAVMLGGAIGACLGDDPAAPTPAPNANDGAPPGTSEAGKAALAFEASIARLVPRDSSIVQISVKLAAPSSETVTFQVVNPPVGISSQPRAVPASVTEDQLEIRADMSAAPGAAELQIVASTTAGASVTRRLPVIVLGPPGSLDPTLGDGGVAVGGDNTVVTRAAALYPPDKLLIGGVSAGKFALARYALRDGSLDPTFNGGSILTTAVEDAASITSIAVQPDGKIVAVGDARNEGGTNVVALARYDATGGLDPTFGGGSGYTTFAFGAGTADTTDAIAIQGDGKIIVAGDTLVGAKRLISIARRNADGTPDPTFGSNGVVTTPFGNHLGANDVGLFGAATTTRIVVLGNDGAMGAEDFRLVNVFPDGGLGFNHGPIDFGDRDLSAALVTEPSGTTLVVGTVLTPGGQRLGLARVAVPGKVDPTFADAGRVTHGIHSHDNAASIALQADGKILIGGRGIVAPFSGPEVVRLLPSAEIDSTFGTDGYALVPNATGTAEVIHVFPQADGRILAVLSGREFRFMRMFP